MQSVEKFARVPKQARSRLSFDKAIDAAVSLVVERRSDSFTLAEVADRSGVSIGAIYGRVASKADLLRTAHAREMERLTERTLAAFHPGGEASEEFPGAVRRVVWTTGEVLRDNSSILAGFMFLGNADQEIIAVGQASFGHLVDAFTSELLSHRDEFSRSDPERAVHWSFTVVYSVIARWLGLGSDPAAAGEGEWEEMLSELADMVTAYLAR